jgi:hypothetical protein
LKQAAMTLSITTSRTSNGQGDTAILPCQRRHTATTARASVADTTQPSLISGEIMTAIATASSRVSPGHGGRVYDSGR